MLCFLLYVHGVFMYVIEVEAGMCYLFRLMMSHGVFI